MHSRSGLALIALLVGCAGPPSDAYLGGAAGRAAGGIGLGQNTAGENCSLNGGDIFCGSWEQPSGRLSKQAGTDLRTVALSSPWRNGMDARFTCAEPQGITIGGAAMAGSPALLLNCTRKVGGWPQTGLVVSVDGGIYAGDAILPAVPVLERAVAVLSGRVTAEAAPSLPAGQEARLAAARLAAQSFGANDIGQYQALMAAGTRANLAENFSAAERAFRAAYTLQRKALGPNDPNTAVPLTLLALQMSNEGRKVEAEGAFAEAGRLVQKAADPTALPRFQHYRGLGLLNGGDPAAALVQLRAAEQGYAAALPPDLMTPAPVVARGPVVTSRRSGGAPSGIGGNLLMEPDQQAALLGVIETRRYQAIALRELGRPDDARLAAEQAQALATARGLNQRDLSARLSRTRSLVDELALEGSGEGLIRRASLDFDASQPGTRPLAETLLLQAAQTARGSTGTALPTCRRAVGLLSELRSGTASALMAPCLQVYATEAERRPSERQALLGEMFEAAQLVQGSVTARQIALASARLGENAKNPRVGEAIRRQQDATLRLAELQREADLAAASQGGGRRRPAEVVAKELQEAQAGLADSDSALQAAAPNYGQLVQQVAPAKDVLAALAPGEALLFVTLEAQRGWVFALRDGTVTVAHAGAGGTAVAGLVKRVRDTVEAGPGGGPKRFDAEAAQGLYGAVIAPVEGALAGADALTVVPVGALLSLPWEVMLTGPAPGDDLAGAPWLVKRFAITHIPAPANFVSLRRVANSGTAARPWFGFGEFRPVTLQQAARTFPAETCRDSARLFAGLPPLPFAARELTAARLLMGAPANDQLLGPQFNAPRVVAADLRPFRVLHFATHALLPTELSCQTEPAIVTSDVPGAADAKGALLTASDVTGMQLDADVVILSACNSGGPNGDTAGESLSGLARSFFYAGARSMLVTHWSINDQATALLVAGTLQRLREGNRMGLAGAFRDAQLAMLGEAGKGLPAAIAHPFYWAPFALVGEGRGRTVMAAQATGARFADGGTVQGSNRR